MGRPVKRRPDPHLFQPTRQHDAAAKNDGNAGNNDGYKGNLLGFCCASGAFSSGMMFPLCSAKSQSDRTVFRLCPRFEASLDDYIF
jgi:hypothetical protein